MIRAILYDLGDIFFEAHDWRQWLFEQLRAEGLVDGSFRDFYHAWEEALAPVYRDQAEYAVTLEKFLRAFGVAEVTTFMSQALREKKRIENARSLYPEVKATLAALQERNIRNIVISDNELSESEIRQQVLARHGINPMLDRVYTSHDLGVTKPNPRVFELVFQAEGLQGSDVLFVAHDRDEIDGAVALGLRVVEYNNYLGEETKAHIRINHFGELLNHV